MKKIIEKIKEYNKNKRIKALNYFKSNCIKVHIQNKTLYLHLYVGSGYGDFGEYNRIKPELYSITENKKIMIYKSKHNYSENYSKHKIVKEFIREFSELLVDIEKDDEIMRNGFIINTKGGK